MDSTAIQFKDLFDIGDIQRIQDEFATAMDVASIITEPDGTPITQPSNFCRLCSDIIRKTEQGLSNCFKSDAAIGRFNPQGPTIKPCLSGGLWDAGAGISLEGRHVANWLIGQVRDAQQTEDTILAYARQIGADETQALAAFREVPVMSREKFTQISRMLFSIANQLSMTAFQNIQQARLIHAMKKTEKKLRDSEERYRDIFNASNDAIFIIDDKTGTILDVNAPMLSMYGYDRQEVLGVSITRFSSDVSPYDHPKAMAIIQQAKTRGSQIFEWHARKKDGTLFWAEVSLRFSAIGEQKKIIAVARDISERKQTQEIMIQTEKMMSVGGLAAGMAHEINNPLAGILQNLNLLSNRLTRSDIPANCQAADEAGISMDMIAEYARKRGIPRIMQAITDAGLRVAAIVDNMLSFARKGESSFSSHNPADLLDRALELAATDYDLKKHYDFKSISIEKAYDRNLPLVPCEGNNIQQVILNILGNGAYAMFEAKSSSRPRFVIRADSEADTGMIRIAIEDNGPGIDPAIQKKIFEPFFTTKPVNVGTGLGLSVSYFIVTKNHKGRLEVVSEPGKGTTFTIRLPLHQTGPSDLSSINS